MQRPLRIAPGTERPTRPGALRWRNPACVALVVLGLYGAWIGAYLAAGHDIRDFIRIGTTFIADGHGHSRAIHLDPGYRPPANQNSGAHGLGYDGQFAYYIALDPTHARYYIDIPPLRYGRILYPMLARYLALAHRSAIPWTMLLINLFAVVCATWGLAIWLRRRGVSPYWALIYGLWPGMVISVQRDLNEPLAYGLVIAALLVLDTRWRARLLIAGIVFGLAGLAYQATLVFPAIIAMWLLLGGEFGQPGPLTRGGSRREMAGFLALSLAPLIAYSAFLYAWLGSLSDGGDLTWVPFGGLFHGPVQASHQGVDFAFVVLPLLVALVVLAPRRLSVSDQRWLPWLLMLVYTLLDIVFFGQFHNVTYTSVSRQTIGIVLAALLLLPSMTRLGDKRAVWLTGSATLAMVMLPVVAVYGFTNLSP